MTIKLDDLDLIKGVQSGSNIAWKDIRNVYNISIKDRRNIIELQIPGSEGNVLQDMGCDPVRISLFGEMMGVESKLTLEKLRSKFDKNKPFQFYSDISSIPEINQVLIDEFYVEEMIGTVHRFQISSDITRI